MRSRDREKITEFEDKLHVQRLLYQEEYERMSKSLMDKDGLEGSGYKSCSDSNYLLREISYRISVLEKRLEGIKKSLLVRKKINHSFAKELERRSLALEEALALKLKIKEDIDYSIINRSVNQLSGLSVKLTAVNRLIAQRKKSLQNWENNKIQNLSERIAEQAQDDKIVSMGETKLTEQSKEDILKQFFAQYSNPVDLSKLSTKVEINWEE